MNKKNLPSKILSHDDLVKKLAWEVARNVLDYQKFVYSEIFKNAPSTFSISIRNGIYNQISDAIKCHTDDEIIQWIAKSESHRKEMQRLKRLSKRTQKANECPKKINEILKELK